MRNGGSRAVIPAALAWLAVLLVTVGLHPVLRGGGPVPEEAEKLGRSVPRLVEGLSLLGEIDRGSFPAIVALVVSLFYASGHLVLRLSHPASESSRAVPGGSFGLPLAAMAGHLGGWFVAEAGGKLSEVLACTLAIALLVSIPILRRASRSADRPRPGVGRSATLLLAGIVLVLTFRTLDVATAWGLGTPRYPDLWYVLYPTLIAPGEIGVLLIGLTLVALPAVLLAGASGENDRWLRQVLLTAPAWALLLGPSNPFQAIGVAVVLARMGSAGVNASWRIAFVYAVVGVPVAAVFLLPAP